MRIALITETFLPSINGVTTTLCRLLDHLQAEGHEALLLAPQSAPDYYAGTKILPLSGVPLPLYPELNFTPPQFGLTQRLRAFEPDILHVVAPAALGAIVPNIAHSLRVPVISSFHTDLVAYSQHYGLGFFKGAFSGYLRWLHNRTRLTLCPSTTTLNNLRQQGFRRLRVWGRGVDTARFHPDHRSEEWRESVGASPDEVILLYVGRVAKEKRINMLEKTLRRLQGEYRVRLVVVGDGPARAELEQRMQGLPVHFTGYLKGAALATAYASSDLFVFPSDTDTFGQVMQEAMASGLPVVAARSGGAPDLVREGKTGYMFEPGVESDLNAQLRRVIADNDLRAAMGVAGRRTAEQRSWSSVMNELLAHYRHVLRRAPTSMYQQERYAA